jgi:TP901 family phage tail tape measure protein
VLEREFQKQEKAAERTARAQRDLSDSIGKGMAVAAAAVGAALLVSVRAAVQWESAFAGVRKTVDGTPEQLAAVEAGLRNMARELPATHQELAAVAAAAGQLGIARDDILRFTGVMVDLGETTNLSADEAATALARFSNIMGTSADDVDRLGSTIVDLGNNSATTEREIVEMGLRIAGAGRQIGLSEDEVLSFAAALSSVGIEAEAGGTAISRTFVTIEQAVRGGGEDLARFAEVAGLSAEEFAAAYRDDAAGAISLFIQGLGGIQQSGGDVFGVLEDLELGEIRVRDALLRAASAGDLFTDSLTLGSAAWEENTALAEEAAQRYATTEAQLQRTRNAFNDAAISVGEVFGPALASAAEDVGTIVGAIADLPDPVLEVVGGFTLATTAAGLLGAAYLILTPKIAAMNATLAATGPLGAKAAGGLRAMQAAAGPIGLAIVGLSLVGGTLAKSWADQQQAIDEYKSSLDEATGALTENTRAAVVRSLQDQGALDAAKALGLELDVVTDAALGNAEAMRIVGARIDDARNYSEDGRSSLNALGSENLRVSDAADRLNGIIGDQTGQLDAATRAWRQEYEAINGAAEAVNKAATEHYEAAGGMDAVAESAAYIVTETESAEDQIDALSTALDNLFGVTLSQQEAADNTAQAIADMADKTAEAKKAAEEAGEAFVPLNESIKAQTQAGRDNRDMIDATILAIGEEAKVMAERGRGIGAITDKTKASRAALVDQIVAMGYSREEALEYTASLEQVPALVETEVTTPGMAKAIADADYLKASLDNIDKNIRIDITTYESTVRQDIAQSNRGGNQPRENWSGGYVTGPGTGTSDSILSYLSNGEYVVRADAVNAVGVDFLDAINRGRMAPGFANGGLVDLGQTNRMFGMNRTGGRVLNVNVKATSTDEARLAQRIVMEQQFAATIAGWGAPA